MAATPLSKTFTIKNLQDVITGLAKWGDAAIPALGVALYEEAENTMTQAKRYTPVDTGNLKASGFVEPPWFSHSAITVNLGFGGPAGTGNHGGQTNERTVGYAVYVHENLTARHKTGRAKFLETAVVERIPELPQSLARRARRALAERGLI